MKFCHALSPIILVVLLTASAALAQNVCTKQTDSTPVKFSVRNATEKPLTVNYVDENCKESPAADAIAPGRAFSGSVGQISP